MNNSKNQWLFNESWGVDVSVCMPLMMTALVEEAVSVGSLVRLLRLERGHATLVEVTLADESPAVGVSIADLDIPAGCDYRRRGLRRTDWSYPGATPS